MDQRVQPTALAARAKTIRARMGISFNKEYIGVPVYFFSLPRAACSCHIVPAFR